MAKERVRSFRYRAKNDQGNFRMRWLRYFLAWVMEQGERLGTNIDDVLNRLRSGATFEDIERSPPVTPTVVKRATLIGDGREGLAHTISPGTYTPDDVNEGYQWYVGGVMVAEGPSYTPVAADVGKQFFARIVYYNTAGHKSYDTASVTVSATT